MDFDAHYYDAIDILSRMITIPSPSREEAAVADWFESYLYELQLYPRRSGNNIWLFPEDFSREKPSILLNSHLDTVKPVSAWTRDPYAARCEDGRLYGLGSNDAGASVVSLLQAFRILTQKEQPCNFIFLASSEEEVSGKGGIESVLPQLPPIALGLVGEPTQMQPAVAERGLMVLDGVVCGQSGHAAREEGINAIYKALPVIEWFRDTKFPLESEWLGPVKMSLTLIQAGTQHNVVPDRCEFTVDVRTNERYANEELFELIASSCDCEVKARSFRLNSSSLSLDHPLVQRAMMLGKIPFGSPTLSDQALMPFPSLKIGPGHSARSHTADEYIEVSEIREAIEMYVKLLDQLNVNFNLISQ